MSDAVELLFDRSPLAADPVCAKRLVQPPAFEPGELPLEVRAVACRAWEARTRSEYVGVMITRKLHGLLVDVNAPMDLQELALVMTLQEQQHAALCAAAARSLGSDGAVAFELSELQQARSAQPIEAQLHEIICGTFAVGEVTALGLIKHALKTLPDSPYRDVLATIAADEVLHGRIGPLLLKAMREGQTAGWLPYRGDETVRRFVARQIQAMRARDVVEADEVALARDPAAAAALARLGIPDPLAFKGAYLAALETDVPAAFAKAGLNL
ncbi:MAG: hypothetical protein KC613_10225 [Myxococcales bacterium]|nr:hypothetical protein [Myxococcales bacterium]MCB9525184.1 hypothetical protein [Myxococcales bacterium]